ncbi:hypothetical protein TGPRC2_259520 [Toxoplasma gondii TgCatPRC2]|uniref:Protein FAM33A n=1 Tax=Toxoplasma gondii TgCatPRC2 TaxID=1130821 RepID=A0A151HM38_TOXGO|nr:hypothetical protein TGPRC2_259520 [Toxoplasma gondii TgCatPRC2]
MEDAIHQLRDRFECMSTDLFIVEQRLDQEFARIYGPERHPRQLLHRLAKVQNDIQTLSEQFQQLFTAKSQLADTLRHQLRSYELLGALQEVAGGEAPAQDIRCEQIYEEGEELLRRWMKTDQRSMQFPEWASDEKGLDRNDGMSTSQGNAAPFDGRSDFIPGKNADLAAGAAHSDLPEAAGTAASSGPEMSHPAFATVGGRSRVFCDVAPARDPGVPDAERGNAEHQTRGASEEPENEACVCGYSPITVSVFEGVPALTRRRSRLGDVNELLHCLYHMRYEKGKEGASTTIRELNHMNLKVVGQTGEAKLSTLRYLRLVDVNPRTGTVRLLVPQRKTRVAAEGGRGSLTGQTASRPAKQPPSSSLRTSAGGRLSKNAASASSRSQSGSRREFGRDREKKHQTQSRFPLGSTERTRYDSSELKDAEKEGRITAMVPR